MHFADFAHMAFNQITNEIAKFRYRSDGDWSVPIVIRAPFGGHAHGALYHSQSIEARFATPGLKIVIPSSPYEAKGLLLASIRDPDPVLFFEHKRLYRMFKEPVPKGEYIIPLQKARTFREGTDISVFCYGLMVHYANEAAKNLEAEGVSVEIIDLRTVYPLDRAAIIASATEDRQMHGPVRVQLQRLGRLRGGCVDRRRSLELARRARQAVRRPGRALDAVRDPDGGVLHADSGKDHQGPPRPGGLLMANTTRVVMPQLGESVHEGTISKWLVKVGDKVVEFEPMLEVDTDKVNAEVPAPVTGILRALLAKEGETVQAGAGIAVVEIGNGAAAPP